jgi:small subunit ribosomal protein S4
MAEGRLVPWLSLDKVNLSGTYLEHPKREDIPTPVEEQLIVELYSK